MTNKKLGNDFETELCELLSQAGFWAHNFSQNQNGQPADVIAVRNGKAYLIDCKVCSTRKGFDLTRVEDNQDLSMNLWEECGNDVGWFAIRFDNQIYMLSHATVMVHKNLKSVMSVKDIIDDGWSFDLWIRKRK